MNRSGLIFVGHASMLVIALLLVSVETANAYIDPGAGSFIIQGLIAGIVGSLFVMKLWWWRLIDTFRSVRQRFKSRGDDAGE